MERERTLEELCQRVQQLADEIARLNQDIARLRMQHRRKDLSVPFGHAGVSPPPGRGHSSAVGGTS
jgi:hypothetical protein